MINKEGGLKREVPNCYGEYTRGESKCKECWADEGCIQLTVFKKHGNSHATVLNKQGAQVHPIIRNKKF